MLQHPAQSCRLVHASAALCLLPPAQQEGYLSRTLYPSYRAKVEAFLRSQASFLAPGAPLITLQTEPFTGANGKVLIVWAGWSDLIWSGLAWAWAAADASWQHGKKVDAQLARPGSPAAQGAAWSVASLASWPWQLPPSVVAAAWRHA